MADPVTRAFARSMLRLRAERGWTQQQLAAKAGTGQAVISVIEAGARGCQLRTAHAIAEALGSDVTAMIAGGGLKGAGNA